MFRKRFFDNVYITTNWCDCWDLWFVSLRDFSLIKLFGDLKYNNIPNLVYFRL